LKSQRLNTFEKPKERDRVRRRPGIIFLLILWVAPLAWAQPPGEQLYTTHCASCHQPGGQGVPGIFPPLAGHIGELYAAEDGPTHLIHVLLFGMQGPISVHGQAYDGLMPAWFQLADEDLAAVLDYAMTAWGDSDAVDAYEPISPEQVAARRGAALSPQLVYERRPEVEPSEETGGDAAELPLATFGASQVERARSLYNNRCADCHGTSFTGGVIGGPPLTGSYFDGRWGNQTVAALFSYTKLRMPLDRPDSLTAQQYADLVALILSVNGHEEGEELPSDPAALEELRIRKQ
jgi:mono/diheme cytochrome c family protein